MDFHRIQLLSLVALLLACAAAATAAEFTVTTPLDAAPADTTTAAPGEYPSPAAAADSPSEGEDDSDPVYRGLWQILLSPANETLLPFDDALSPAHYDDAAAAAAYPAPGAAGADNPADNRSRPRRSLQAASGIAALELPPLSAFLPAAGTVPITSVDAFLTQAGLPSWEELGLPAISELMKPAGGPEGFEMPTVAEALTLANATLVQVLSDLLPPNLQWMAKKAPAVATTVVSKKVNTTSRLRLPTLPKSGGNLDRLLRALKIPGLNATAAAALPRLDGTTLAALMHRNITFAPAALNNLLMGGAASGGGAAPNTVSAIKALASALQVIVKVGTLADSLPSLSQITSVVNAMDAAINAASKAAAVGAAVGR